MSRYTDKQTIIEAHPPTEQVPFTVNGLLSQTFRLMDAGFYFRILGVVLLVGIIRGVLDAFLPHTTLLQSIFSSIVSISITIPLMFATYDYFMQRAERKEPISFIETVYGIINRIGHIYYLALLMLLGSLMVIVPTVALLYVLSLLKSDPVISIAIVFCVLIPFILFFIMFGMPLIPLAVRTNVGIKVFSECYVLMKKNLHFSAMLALLAPFLYICLVIGLAFLLGKIIPLVFTMLLAGIIILASNPFISLYLGVMWVRLLAMRG